MVAVSPAAGAVTSMNCAVNPALNSQQHFYYDSCRPKRPSADSRWGGASPGWKWEGLTPVLLYRNEVFQEQMWKKSFEMIKDHLSAETVEKYGPKADDEPATSQEEGIPDTTDTTKIST